MIRMRPSRKVREEFRLIYELKGAQKAVDMLSRYYGIRRMKIVVVMMRSTMIASHISRKFNKRNVLHEFYHHLAFVYDLDLSDSREEREANRYARIVLKK